MAAQGRGNAISILVFVVALLAIAEAKNYNVGDTNDWDYPDANDPAYYDTWAAKQKFVPGDTLTFTYMAAQHDTTVVSAAEYTSCTMSAGKKYTSGKDVVTLPTAGTYYFYCSVMGHCDMGMKMKVTVAAAAAAPVLPPALPPALAPTPVKAPTPAPVNAPTPAPLLAPTPAPLLAPAPVVAVPVAAPTTVPAAAAPAPAPSAPSSPAVAVGASVTMLAASAGVVVVALFML